MPLTSSTTFQFHLEVMANGMLCLVVTISACEAIYPHRWHVTAQAYLGGAACDSRSTVTLHLPPCEIFVSVNLKCPNILK